MIRFLTRTVIIFLFLELCPLFWFFVDNLIFNLNLFLYVFFILFVYTYYFAGNDEKFNINLDIIYKYILFLFKKPSIFFNYFTNSLKMFFLYTLHFKYRSLIDTNRFIISILFGNKFLTWRPLFKKLSYFGYYRSNRSKWIK